MSREDVIRLIIKREQQGASLVEANVLQDDPELHRGACDHFGTWKTCLQYAGVSLKRVNHECRYSPENITRQLRRLCTAGYRLTATHVATRDRALYNAALQHFGQWSQALCAAGINPDRIRTTESCRQHSRQQLIEMLRERDQRGQTMCWRDISCEDNAFALIVRTKFGGWHKALVAAGLAVPRARRDINCKWNQARVVVALQMRQKDGLAMHRISKEDGALAAAAVRYFGGLHNALEAADLADEEE